MRNEEVQLRHGFFQQANTLILRTHTSHTMAALTQPQKNVEVKVMLISRQAIFKTKKGDIHQYLFADETGCGLMNLSNETARSLTEGDILFVSGAYTSLYKDSLILYEGTFSLVRRVGRKLMRVNLVHNISRRNPQ